MGGVIFPTKRDSPTQFQRHTKLYDALPNLSKTWITWYWSQYNNLYHSPCFEFNFWHSTWQRGSSQGQQNACTAKGSQGERSCTEKVGQLQRCCKRRWFLVSWIRLWLSTVIKYLVNLSKLISWWKCVSNHSTTSCFKNGLRVFNRQHLLLDRLTINLFRRRKRMNSYLDALVIQSAIVLVVTNGRVVLNIADNI